MKIFFVSRKYSVAPLGIMYLSASLKGHETWYFDNLAELYDYHRFFNPDYVCYSVMAGDNGELQSWDRYLRYHGLKHKTVWGGNHVTFSPEEFDGFVIRGEGEHALCALLEGKQSDEIHYIDDLDGLPFPDRKIIKEGKIKHFITSRGCPFSCTYCFNEKWAELHKKKRIRQRSVDNVIKEIKEVNPEFAYFQDDIFGLNKEWLGEFSKQINIPYHCHTRAEVVDELYAARLKKSGCVSVHIALESVNQLDVLGRKKAPIYEACKILKQSGIKIMLQNIIGIPGGTIHDDLETLKANMDIQPEYSWVSIFHPYPGTVLGDRCIEEKLCDPKDITPTFFDGSILNFDETYKNRLRVLQKTWASLVDGNYDPLLDKIYRNMRNLGDERLYGFKP